MSPETIIFLAVGAVFVVFGLLIWKREKIDLIHSYHYNKVRGKDKKAYCSLMGQGCTVIGAGLLAGAFLNEIFGMKWLWTSFAFGFFIGIFIIIGAVAKYNK